MKNNDKKIGIVGFLVLMLATPLVASGGVHVCVVNGVKTFSDQHCNARTGAAQKPAGRPIPDMSLLAVRHQPAVNKAQKNDSRERRKALKSQIRKTDEELKWMYRERRVAMETFVAERLAEAESAGTELDIEAELEAFEEQYKKTIKSLKRELADMRAELDSMQNGRT